LFLGVDSKRELYQRATDVPAGYFQDSKIRIQDSHRVKAYQFKRGLMPFVSSLEKTNGYGFGKARK
jgi:hypothetical protein